MREGQQKIKWNKNKYQDEKFKFSISHFEYQFEL